VAGVCKGSRVHAGIVSMQMVGFFHWRTDFTMVELRKSRNNQPRQRLFDIGSALFSMTPFESVERVK